MLVTNSFVKWLPKLHRLNQWMNTQQKSVALRSLPSCKLARLASWEKKVNTATLFVNVEDTINHKYHDIRQLKKYTYFTSPSPSYFDNFDIFILFCKLSIITFVKRYFWSWCFNTPKLLLVVLEASMKCFVMHDHPRVGLSKTK